MSTAQTEARAIALDVYNDAVDSDDGSHSMDMNVATDIIATALAAKDAELAEAFAEIEKLKNLVGDPEGTAAHAEAFLARAERAEAQLTETMKQRDHWRTQDKEARDYIAAIECVMAEADRRHRDALTTERAAHAETMRERDELKADINSYAEASSNLATELFKAEAQRDEALKALEPFARHIDEMKFDLDNNGNLLPDDQAVGWVYVTNGDFRAARCALTGGKNG